MRKIIQLLTNDCHKLIALCNDGTVLVETRLIGDIEGCGWSIQDWPVPQPEVKASLKKVEFDFSSWPNSVDPKIFKDLCKSRKSKHKVDMTQTYINNAAKHLHELHGFGISVNEAMTMAAVHAWQGFKSKWVTEQLDKPTEPIKVKVASVGECFTLLKSGALKSIRDIDPNVRKEIETMYKIGKLPHELQTMLDNIGLVL